jgi:predicted Zn-dependent protease
MKRLLLSIAAIACAGLGPAFAQPERYDRTAERAPGLRPAPETDEGGLWDVGARAEAAIRRSGVVKNDAALNTYVRDIACELTGAHCQDLRVYIIEQPVWNAFMMPNGTMAVYTGLMLRMDNEAELSCVVGHEAGHFIQNHSLENYRRSKNTATFALLASIGLGAAGAPGGSGDLVGVAAVLTLLSYNRAQETEADRIGFDKIAGAGYDLSACANVWRKLLTEFETSDQSSARRRANGDTSIFDTHPGAADRIKALDELAAARKSETAKLHDERYHAAIRPHLVDWLRADLRRKDFGSSLHFIDRRIAAGRDLGVYHFFKGEALRLRRKPEDKDAVKAAFSEAIKHADAPAEAWRELGYVALKDNANAEARTLLSAYLQKAPAAEDKLLIEGELKKLGAATP